MEQTHLRNTFSLDVSGYACTVRALSIGEYQSLKERAFTYITAQDKEDIILSCLVSPSDLIDLIKKGDIEFGIPLTIYDAILEFSGFTMSQDERTYMLNRAREYISSDVLESCKIMILSAGTLDREAISKLDMMDLLKEVAIAEGVLFIQQQNLLSAINEGGQLRLTWETPDPRQTEVMQMHQEKVSEVQELLDMQTAQRLGRGMRRM